MTLEELIRNIVSTDTYGGFEAILRGEEACLTYPGEPPVLFIVKGNLASPIQTPLEKK